MGEEISHGQTEGTIAKRGRQSSHDGSFKPTLKDLGVSDNESSRWQAVAAIPDDEFEAGLGRLGRVAHFHKERNRHVPNVRRFGNSMQPSSQLFTEMFAPNRCKKRRNEFVHEVGYLSNLPHQLFLSLPQVCGIHRPWLVAMRQVTVETAVLARYAPRHGKAIVLS